MQPLSLLPVVAVFSLLAHSFPVETNVPDAIDASVLDNVTDVMTSSKMASKDRKQKVNAIDIRLDYRNLPDLSEADCYAILCKGKQTLLRRTSNESQKRDNYRDSGAARAPFKDRASMGRMGVDRPYDAFVSAEEWPPEGSRQGGRNALIFPVPEWQQHSQGGRMNSAFERYNVKPGRWYNIVDFDGANGYFCSALRRGDRSVCFKERDGKDGYDPSKYAYKKISGFGQRTKFQFVGRNSLGRRDKSVFDDQFENEDDE